MSEENQNDPLDRDQVLRNAEEILKAAGTTEHASTLFQSYMPILIALSQIKASLRNVIGFTEETTELMCLTVWNRWFASPTEGYYEDDDD